MGVEDGDPGVVEAVLDRGGGGFAEAQLFPDALEDEHVGVDAHTDREDDAGDAGERQCGVAEAHKTEQDDQVEEQGEIGVDPRAAIVDEHEDHDGQHAGNGGGDALVDACSAEGRANGTGFEVLDGGRQRAGAQHHAEVLGLLLGEAAGDAALVADGVFNDRHFADVVLKHDGHLPSTLVGFGVLIEAVAGLGGEGEADVRAAVFVL